MTTIEEVLNVGNPASRILWRLNTGSVKVHYSVRVGLLGSGKFGEVTPKFKSGQENEMVLRTMEDFLERSDGG